MNVKDIDKQTSRLQVAKRALIQLINQLHGERVGIVIFAGNAYTQLPLTMDYETAKMYLNEIETDMVSNQGTNIRSALEISESLFTKSKAGKAILIVTDGEDHESGIDEILKSLKEKKIQLAILGIGSQNGGLIPNDYNRPELGFKVDEKGSFILSKMNPSMIKELASKSGGFYTISSDSYPDLRNLLAKINKIKRSKKEGFEFEVKENRYQIPLFLSFLCLILFVGWKGIRKPINQ
jgi:Ca-activated chloride channel homolog